MNTTTAISQNTALAKESLSRVLSTYRNRKANIESDAITQFIEGLRSDLELANDGITASGQEAVSLVSKITNKLNEADSREIPMDGKWNLAYHAEKLIISLLKAERQEIELHRRLSECKRLGMPFAAFYQDQIDNLTSEADNSDHHFNILISLVRDMQHFNSNKHIKMRYARLAIYRVGLVFGLSLITFLTVISLFHWV